jgi:hypothetical protein
MPDSVSRFWGWTAMPVNSNHVLYASLLRFHRVAS